MHKILLLMLCDEICESRSVSLLSQMDISSLIAVFGAEHVFWYAFSQSFVFQIIMKF